MEFDFNNISDEVKEKARRVESAEELAALAESEGVELPDSVLEGVSGGSVWSCKDHAYYAAD